MRHWNDIKRNIPNRLKSEMRKLENYTNASIHVRVFPKINIPIHYSYA